MVELRITDYDKYIVAFSGGKDSLACFLYLLDNGVDKSKIELWHHLVDGQKNTLMDWECTEDYCRKIAEYFGVQIFFSWKEGGFEREMTRNNSLTAPVYFETPEGLCKTGGTLGKKSTRMKFPQVSPDLSVRWCSSYLKIDVCSAAIRNQKRFVGINTLLLSGERAEESKARAGYKTFERDRADLKDKRNVFRFRPIKEWSERKVWMIIKKYKITPHPCYYLGFSRCSCKFCIFGNSDQFATANLISPDKSKILQDYESSFGHTLKRNETIKDLITKGNPYQSVTDDLKKLATSKVYYGSIISKNWVLPSGAFGKSCGPV